MTAILSEFLLLFLGLAGSLLVSSEWMGEDFIPDGPIAAPFGESDYLLMSASRGLQQPEEAAAVPLQYTDLRMPGVLPQFNESYLCTSFPLDTEEMHYLVGFESLADPHKVHHVLLYGCEEPGSQDPVWDCGEMSPTKGGQENRYSQSPICQTSPNILYAWAKGAPKFELPKGVGFPVGSSGTENRHLILQIHYMHKPASEDSSGLRVASTMEPQPKTAATLLMATDGHIPAKKTEHLEVACVVDEPVTMHPFAFRVAGWLVEENESGQDKWTLLGERDPQLPQLFQPVLNQSLVIEQGDILAARCTIKNTQNRAIKIGPTGDDEMCNFYLMYWVDGDRTLDQNTCFSSGAPNYHWSSSAGLNHIPK